MKFYIPFLLSWKCDQCEVGRVRFKPRFCDVYSMKGFYQDISRNKRYCLLYLLHRWVCTLEIARDFLVFLCLITRERFVRDDKMIVLIQFRGKKICYTFSVSSINTRLNQNTWLGVLESKYLFLFPWLSIRSFIHPLSKWHNELFVISDTWRPWGPISNS